MRLRIGIAILIFLLAGTTAFSQEDARLDQLQKRILEQQKVLNELEKQLGEKENTSRKYTEKVVSEYLSEPATKEAQPVIAGYNKGFFIKDSTGDYEFKLNGYARHTLFFTDTGTVQENSVIPLDARINFHFYYKKDWHIQISPEFTNNGNLTDVFVEYLGISYLKVRAGQYKVPFSMEVLQNSADLMAIMSSPFLTSIPGRDMGVMLFGDGIPFLLGELTDEYLSYAVGLFNGSGSNTLNAEDNFMFVAQARFYPLTLKEKEVYVHAAVMTNDREYREQGARLAIFGGMKNNVHTVFGANARNTFDDNDVSGNQVGVDVGGHYEQDGLRIELEYMFSRFNRDKADYNNDGVLDPGMGRLEMWAVSAGISYFIALGDEKQKFGVEPLFKFSYTTIDDDGKRKQIAGSQTDGQDIWEVVLGARVHLNKHTRVDLNWAMYDLSETRGYTNKENGGGGMIHAGLAQFIFSW